MMLMYRRFLDFCRPYNIVSKLPYLLSLLAIILGFSTYWALSRSIGIAEKSKLVSILIYSDVVLLMCLLFVVAKRSIGLWIEKKQGLKGSKLHAHIVVLFVVVSVAPAICVAFFSAQFFNISVNAWFGKPVHDALNEASVVADAYLKEYKKTVMYDTESLKRLYSPLMAGFLEHHDAQESFDELSENLSREAEERGLIEVLIFEGQKSPRILGRSYLSFSLLFEDLKDALKLLKKYPLNPAVIESKANDRVRALIKLDCFGDIYLLVGKVIDQKILKHVNLTQSAIQDYAKLEGQHEDVQVTFVVFFTIVALLLLLAAIWGGLVIADSMVKPITRLIAAAESVAEGDLSTKLEIQTTNNEIDDLCKSFNRMTHQLLQQKHDLILSEKKSAWADMARKIAHEIKNPLTPIQLSAERLKRRYLKEITSDVKTFQDCVDTIIRQVGSIGNLVNEFSSFARMPEPKLEYVNWCDLSHQCLFLQMQAHPDVNFEYVCERESYFSMVDAYQMTQVLTNLLQNAINSVKENIHATEKPHIRLRLYDNKKILYIMIEDNGPGFPKSERTKLLEPYYTTREKGTGLGLAIVYRIVSDHQGRIELRDSEDLKGANVVISFTYSPNREKDIESNVA